MGRPLLEKIPKSLTNISSTIFPAQVRVIRVEIGLDAITTLLALMGCGFDVMADGKLKALQNHTQLKLRYKTILHGTPFKGRSNRKEEHKHGSNWVFKYDYI